MTNRFDRNLRMGYGFSLLMLLVVGLVSYLTLNSLLSSNRAVAHSGEVMQQLEKLLSVMKDAETGQRGYLLTGRSNYLEPYNGAYRAAETTVQQLQDLTSDNKEQQTNIAAIRGVLRQRLDILQEMVTKKQRGEAIGPSDLDAGKAAMDALRDAVAKAEDHEQQLLKERNATLDTYSTITPIFIIAAILLALGITAYSYRQVVGDVREKDRLRNELEASEEETQALNEELTAANEEITAANEELQAINEELWSAREELATTNVSLEGKVNERTKSLQDTEEETQSLNEELTAINEELAATNEELMATNEELAESKGQMQLMLDELRLAEERSAKLVAIVESSDDGIIGKDLEGNITSWNRGAEHIFGYSEAEIIGKSVLTLIPEDRQDEEPGILARLRNGEKIDHYETIRKTQDGRLIDVSLTISPIKDKDGKVTGVSKIARDISEQKRDEQRKNDFIAMASHELKTPLTSLTALIQVLQLKLRDSEESFVPNALDKAVLQTRRMSSLISGFLNVSRLESGKLVIEKQRVDLSTLIREMISEVRLSVTGHTFVFDSPKEIALSADKEKVGSVISNLLSNAVKYSPKGELVTIDCKVVNGEAVVSVKDEGMGVKPTDVPRLFDRYYRVASEHTKHISGFGVGLYLSAEIIRQHGGRIWVESEKGVGSTFYFTLPIA
ncbi:CHASE3 domain-containing protein [Mucilaginibacter myungsuensis]|uniref:histidine kinase n=1 Tax=Mucilaginibacter myungsuensis TaxID=649104 RepID=A0A929KZZ7_9SPHI|nr:CHASE3 domain-containing protein [Mucilaginibacter myungsuensis]MBE9661650.1 CHASE3 domain-containing protein [Mucilaginibacter myungsuensis]MDN3597794.1 CHASE3 domain-containing protein [Mucilaginibacter myungsuensis]